MVGDFALCEDKPSLHARLVVGRRDGTAEGGHLIEAIVNPHAGGLKGIASSFCELRRIGGFMAIASAIGTMKAAQVLKAGADFKIVEREIPEPGAGHVRIKVQALWCLPQ